MSHYDQARYGDGTRRRRGPDMGQYGFTAGPSTPGAGVILRRPDHGKPTSEHQECYAVSQISRSYGSFRAVEDVSFHIGKGEIVGLLGHNGAGKTTIMKMLSGYIEPDAGQRSRWTAWTWRTRAMEIQASLGYLPENLPVYPEMTIAEYLDYVGTLKGPQYRKSGPTEIRRCIDITDLQGESSTSASTPCPGDFASG